MAKTKLILMRHGESVWNKKNLFTGWVDVPLSDKGIEEAIEGGKKIKDIPIDIIFMSTLIRAQMTGFLAMQQHSTTKTLVVNHEKGKLFDWGNIFNDKTKEDTIEVYFSWHLNERMYGELQGNNKDEMRAKFGKEQVHIWRRSFDVAPKNGESLKMTSERTLPYFKDVILPHLDKNKNVFIAAHGNSLRSIVMFLDKLSGDEVVKLEIPTGEPIIYEYENKNFIRTTKI
ncbi:MAG: 2,3-bisphosphoglycerate-dependent phosphoglycerate mutase [Candidatus Anoxychlamydiales bacterium]|nr:2,3-bisphosphoglycerate-dependent phosphoglycerate mutase [Candidatus Anoxychlamydiales bacterium]